MANAREGNVVYVDTTASFTDVKTIKGIKYVGNTNGRVAITAAPSSDPLWEQNGATDAFDDVCISCKEGITVTITNGAKAYIYS